MCHKKAPQPPKCVTRKHRSHSVVIIVVVFVAESRPSHFTLSCFVSYSIRQQLRLNWAACCRGIGRIHIVVAVVDRLIAPEARAHTSIPKNLLGIEYDKRAEATNEDALGLDGIQMATAHRYKLVRESRAVTRSRHDNAKVNRYKLVRESRAVTRSCQVQNIS